MAQYPLGFSTSWNAAGRDDGREIVSQIRQLGFSCLEVEYRVSQRAVEGIEQAVRAGEIQVLSVHNYSPLRPRETASRRGGDKLSLASPDENERTEAVCLTLASLRLAQRLGARALVLHLGEIDMPQTYFQEMVEAVTDKGVRSQRAQEIRQRVRQDRDRRKGPFLKAAVRSLRELLPHAQETGIALGVENRYYYHQVPLPSEIVPMIEDIDSPFLRYWHDVGHAHVMEVLGLVEHLETLYLLKDHMLGVHLHDSVFIRDHAAPGTGDLDFRTILGKTPESAIKVVELASSVTPEEIIRAAAYLESLGLKTHEAGS